MSEFEGFDVDAEAEKSEARKLAAVRLSGREAAIERGRLLGEDTARQMNETGLVAEQRIARAKRYAAWEFDGKPTDRNDRYEAEFGVSTKVGTLAAWDADPKRPR